MHCVYPHCEGTLTPVGPVGYCETCRLPAQICRACGAWNRTQAALCRTCGLPLPGSPSQSAPDAPQIQELILDASPVRLRIEEPIRTLPAVSSGFLWAMGEQGNLYRINPYERDGRSPDVCTRFWANAAPHAFVLRDLPRGSHTDLTETFAVVSTVQRIMAWGLVTHATHTFAELQPGEQILADARDRYQLIDADGGTAFCLTQKAGEMSLLEVNLLSGSPLRHSLGTQGAPTPICGPVLVGGRVLAWSSQELFTLVEGAVRRQALPPGVELWTEPAESSPLRLPLGRAPSMVVGSSVFLPCNHYGAAALLRAQAVGSGWSLAAVPVPSAGGTLAQDSERNPLLASAGRLLRCQGNTFRELASDDQMSARFAAFQAPGVLIFFCEGEYGVRSHEWIQVRSGAGAHRMQWSPEGNQLLKECGGFFMVGEALLAQLLIEDRQTSTEFLSWHG